MHAEVDNKEGGIMMLFSPYVKYAVEMSSGHPRSPAATTTSISAYLRRHLWRPKEDVLIIVKFTATP